MSRTLKIAVVDDEPDMRESISQWLVLSGFDTETFASADEALKVIGADWPGVVVSDIRMPGMDGMAFLKRLMGIDSGLPVIMITGHGDVPMAVEAMRLGAMDFMEKPFNPDRMTELAKRATQARRMTLDARALRRDLAEGSAVSPFALLGSALGFILGFKTWNALYSLSVADAPVVWLPAHLGYGGALLVQLGGLALVAAWLWRGFAREAAAPGHARTVPALRALWRSLWTGRWPFWLGGLAVGLIGAFAIVRMRPLGVTATLGGAARQWAQGQGWIPDRLDGLDGFAGCATAPQSTWFTPNALLLAGLVVGAFVAALASRQFAPRWPTWRDAVRGLSGGVLLGWGAMTGLGCTIGTLLSGGMAGALSGWVFGAAVFLAVWAGLQVKAVLVRK